ncbi:hypothetical protein LF817_18735 [Halobacillus sp. A1]|uniref:WD40 repeat domain-containing protein n=1 Tax=Halobacillus sp. A1 TaxID=2880262 RepID=UPI0020A6D62B|nr:hypothetical protein [Halobacillus sp. A1]MCP3033364.1 hypothetical protein [Halobacillus sp. A1]
MNGKKIQGHSSHVNAVKYHPEGDYILSAGFSGELYLWDRSTYEKVQVFEGHNQTVNSIIWLNNGKELISASGDGKILLHEISQSEPLNYLQDLKSGVSHMHLTYDEQYLVTSNKTSNVRVREWPDGDLVYTRKSDQRNSGVLCAAKHEPHVIVGGVGNKIRRLLIPSGEMIEEVDGHEYATMGFRFFDEDRHGISVGYDGTMMIWDMETHQVLEKLNLGGEGYYSFALSHDDKEVGVAMPYNFKRIQLNNLFSTEKSLPAKGNYGVDYSPDGRQIAVASADKSIRFFDRE